MRKTDTHRVREAQRARQRVTEGERLKERYRKTYIHYTRTKTGTRNVAESHIKASTNYNYGTYSHGQNGHTYASTEPHARIHRHCRGGHTDSYKGTHRGILIKRLRWRKTTLKKSAASGNYSGKFFKGRTLNGCC